MRKLLATFILTLILSVSTLSQEPVQNLGKGFETKTRGNVVLIHFPRKCYIIGGSPHEVKAFRKCVDQAIRLKFGKKVKADVLDLVPLTETEAGGPIVGIAILLREGPIP